MAGCGLGSQKATELKDAVKEKWGRSPRAEGCEQRCLATLQDPCGELDPGEPK